MIRFRIAAILCLVVAAAVSVSAARLPAWASDQAAMAPVLPEGVPDEDFITVLQDLKVTVHADGKLTSRNRIARQVLSSTAWYAGFEAFFSGDNSRIKKLNAWHLPPRGPNGRRRMAEKSGKNEAKVLSVGGSFTQDDLSHQIGSWAWDIRPGSMVFFEAVTTESPYDLTLSEFYYLSGPLALGRVQVEIPAGWSVLSEWLNVDGPEASVSGSLHTWEIRDLAAVETEELGDPIIASSPVLHMSFVAPAGVKPVGASLPDLPAVAGWYDDLASGMADSSESIRSAAATLAGEGDDVAGIMAVAREIRDKVRYIAKEVGIEGYKPRPASDTWDNLYGDCKDKATLLESMLTSRDIQSYQVWVNATRRGTVSESVPGPGLFNHQILAVALPPESEQGMPDLPAVMPATPLGPLMIIDTTDDTTSPGWLPSHLAGKKALILTDKEGYLLDLPAFEPEAHRFEREVRVRPLEDGSWHFAREERLYGEYASTGRASLKRSAADLETGTFRWVREYWTGAEPGDFEVTAEADDGAYVEQLEWTVPRLAGRFETMELPPFPEANSLLPTVSVTRRTGPVVYGFPRTVVLSVVVEDLPPETTFPEPGQREGDGWSLETTWTREEGAIRGTMRFVMEKTRYAPEDFRNLRRMYAALKKQAAELIRVPRGS